MIVYCQIDCRLIESDFTTFEEAKKYAKENKGILLKIKRDFNNLAYILEIYNRITISPKDKNKANPFFDECYNCISELAVVTKKEVKKKIKEITSDDWEVRKKYTKNTVIW